MDKPDPSPSGASAANARSATPAAPRQPEGREVRFGVDETGEPTYRRTTATEPEGQDLSDAEIASIEKEPWVGATVIAQMPFECMTCGAQFATVPSDYKCPNDGGGLTSGFWRVPIAPSPRLANSLLAEVKRHRAQPAVSRADAEPSADAPLVAELEMEHCSLCEQMAVDGHELYTCDCCGKLVCSVHSDNAGEHEIVCDSCISLVESRLGREDKADAAPLDALRRAMDGPLKEARQKAVALVDRAPMESQTGGPDLLVLAEGLLRLIDAARAALASAEGASAAPRDERPDELTLLWRAVTPILRSLFYCQFCDAPATCYGAYENRSGVTGSCDEHCGHGNEDGWCKRNDEWRVLLAEADKKPAPGKQSSGPSPDALRDEALGTLKLLLAEHERTLRVLSATTDVELSVEVEMARAVLRRGGR